MAASLALAATVSGCLRVGIPERFGNSSSVAPAAPVAEGQGRLNADRAALSQALGSPLLLYIDPAAGGDYPGGPDKTEGESGAAAGHQTGQPGTMLGCQYLFGLIPFTRVYLQHGIGHLLTESGIDQGIAAGRTVVVTDRNSAPAAAALLAPESSIQPEVESISLNAYDLLFFRYLKASGIVRFYFGSGGNLDHETVQLVDQSEFRSFGHAPALARVLERGAADVTAAGLKQVFELSNRSFRPEPNRSAASGSRRIVLILPPRIPEGIAASLGGFFGASYGYSGAVQFKAGQVERVIQLGLSAAASASGLYPAAIVFPNYRSSYTAAALRRRGPAALGSAGSAWVLSTEILSAAVVEQPKEWANYGGSGPGMLIELRLTLYSMHGGELQLAFSKNERVYKPIVGEADGAWVVTAENGVAELAGRFFAGQAAAAPPE